MKTIGKSMWGVCSLILAALAATAQADEVAITAADSGFVTMAGGSSKGDSVFDVPGPSAPSGPFFNYSVGYEVHYAGGFYAPVLSPMDRKNYFVFDLGAVDEEITGASLKLWSGTLESADASETYVIKETPDQGGALFDVGFLASTASTTGESAFDAVSDMAIAVAASLYAKLGDGAAILATLDVTHEMDATFLDIVFTPAGIDHLNGVRMAGGMLVLGGMVSTVDSITGTTPQQPFGFTDVGLPGTPLAAATPTLVVTTVPEPSEALLMLVGLALLTGVARVSPERKATRAV